jgi:hypothetical protein
LHCQVSALQNGARFLEEHSAYSGEADSPGAVIKKRDAEFVLKVSNLPAQCRLRHTQFFAARVTLSSSATATK